MANSANPFDLALIQLAVGQSKQENLRRAQEKVLEAATGDGQHKPSLIVLPVRQFSEYFLSSIYDDTQPRSVSTRLTV